MPHISIKMYPGRSEEVKKSFAEKLQKLTVEELGCQPCHVSVSVEDIAPENWKSDVVDKIDQKDLIIEANF